MPVFLEGIDEIRTALGLDAAWRDLVHTHSSTVATNALIERKGARIGLLVSSGFRDLFELQRLAIPHPMPLRFDPKRVRYFAKSAGRLAKNDPIDAEMSAWFAETFATEVSPAPDPDRQEVDQLMTARAMLVRLESQIKQLGEHRQPPVVERAGRAIAKAVAAQRKQLEAAIATRIERQARFAARRAIDWQEGDVVITNDPYATRGTVMHLTTSTYSARCSSTGGCCASPGALSTAPMSAATRRAASTCRITRCSRKASGCVRSSSTAAAS